MSPAESSSTSGSGRRLVELLAEGGLPPLEPSVIQRFESYLSLLLRWNVRINLTAIREEESILSRHFVESIACARALPQGIATLLDLGSGGGFPGIPISICRPELRVTLAESQGKKAAFLQEAVRVLELHADVHAARGETLKAVFGCVTLRAVDRMAGAVRTASGLVAPGGWLAVLATAGSAEALRSASGGRFSWSGEVTLPGSESRILLLGQRRAE